MRSGHLRAEDVLPEVLPQGTHLPPQDLPSEDVLPEGLRACRVRLLRSGLAAQRRPRRRRRRLLLRPLPPRLRPRRQPKRSGSRRGRPGNVSIV